MSPVRSDVLRRTHSCRVTSELHPSYIRVTSELHPSYMHTHTHTRLIASVYTHRPSVRSDVLRRTQTYSIYSCRVLEHPHLCAQTGASRAFRACVGQADAQGASCQAATRPLSLESLWSEQKELKVKGLESLWSEKKELKELKVKCGWPAAGLRQSNICGWPAAGLRLACGWPAAVKHARKAPQNPVRIHQGVRLPTVRSSSIQFDPVRSSSIRPRRACAPSWL